MTTRRRPSGPPPLPHVAINPAFYHRVRDSGLPIFRIATIIGATHATIVSHLICAESVRASVINLSRLEQIAEIVGFDKAQLFLGEAAPR